MLRLVHPLTFNPNLDTKAQSEFAQVTEDNIDTLKPGTVRVTTE